MNHRNRLRRLEENLPLNRLRMHIATADDLESRGPAGDIARHARLAGDLVSAICECIPEVAAIVSTRSKVEAIKALVEAADKAIRLERLVHGIREGEPSAREERDDDGTVRIIRTIVPAPQGDYRVSDLLRGN